MTVETQLEPYADVLRARLDELATGLLVAGVASILPEHLALLADEAEQNGLLEAASVARALGEQINTNDLEEAARKQILCDGLSAIRLALDKGNAAAEQQGGSQMLASEPAPPSTPATFAEDPELIADFLMEASEHLALIESQMLELEQNPGAMEVVHSVFRTFHTIKGLAGFLEFDAIQAVAHHVETLLDLARNE